MMLWSITIVFKIITYLSSLCMLLPLNFPHDVFFFLSSCVDINKALLDVSSDLCINSIVLGHNTLITGRRMKKLHILIILTGVAFTSFVSLFFSWMGYMFFSLVFFSLDMMSSFPFFDVISYHLLLLCSSYFSLILDRWYTWVNRNFIVQFNFFNLFPVLPVSMICFQIFFSHTS